MSSAAEAAQQAVRASTNGQGVDGTARIVAFHPNSLTKGFIATGIAFVALSYAQKMFRDAYIEGALDLAQKGVEAASS